EEVVHLLSCDPYPRQYAHVGAVLEDETDRPGPHLHSSCRRLQLVEYQGKVLALARSVTLEVEKLRRMRHRVEQDAELRREVQRQDRLLSRREVDRIDHDFLEQPLVRLVRGKVD